MAKVDVKVVLLGQQSVGKTCLVDRYINSTFETAPKNTIGVAFAAKKVACKNGRVISLGIWDTAGAERFEALSRMYYNGAKAAVLAFDPCNAKSFEKLKFWVAEVRETQPDCRLYIAITKCDQLDEPPSIAEQDTGEPDSSSSSNGDSLHRQPSSASLASATGRREVSDEDITAYAKQLSGPRHGAPRIFATSAKQGTGVRRLFQAIADDMAGVPQPPPVQPEARQTSPIRLGEFKFSDTFLNSPSTPHARATTPPGSPHAKPKRSSCC